jgi:hypothetical protein
MVSVDIMSAWRDNGDGYPLVILLFSQKRYIAL